MVNVFNVKQEAFEKLVWKFENWLAMQPEYPILFLDDHHTRKRISRELAKRFMLIPKRGDDERTPAA